MACNAEIEAFLMNVFKKDIAYSGDWITRSSVKIFLSWVWLFYKLSNDLSSLAHAIPSKATGKADMRRAGQVDVSWFGKRHVVLVHFYGFIVGWLDHFAVVAKNEWQQWTEMRLNKSCFWWISSCSDTKIKEKF